MKLTGQIDLDEWSKSCHRLEIPRDLLLGVLEVPRAKIHQKFPVPTPQKLRLYCIELKFFFVIARTQSGAVCFVLKNTVYKSQEKQNTEVIVKNVFSASKNFVKAAKSF